MILELCTVWALERWWLKDGMMGTLWDIWNDLSLGCCDVMWVCSLCENLSSCELAICMFFCIYFYLNVKRLPKQCLLEIFTSIMKLWKLLLTNCICLFFVLVADWRDFWEIFVKQIIFSSKKEPVFLRQQPDGHLGIMGWYAPSSWSKAVKPRTMCPWSTVNELRRRAVGLHYGNFMVD